jgi:hypothetical protein
VDLEKKKDIHHVAFQGAWSMTGNNRFDTKQRDTPRLKTTPLSNSAYKWAHSMEKTQRGDTRVG